MNLMKFHRLMSQPARRCPPRSRLQVECLEDRTVPSGGYVFQNIDPPLAAQVSIPTLINNSGEIVGAYTDANFVFHGYVLHGGHYLTLDAPNAGTAPGQGTAALGINDSEKITGTYIDANYAFHGFLLRRGHYTTLDDPNAGTWPGQGTQAGMSDAFGNIVGVYTDANSVQHGFLLRGGHYITLDDPNAGTGAGQGTNVQGINAAGVIAGYYYDANSVEHGFVLHGSKYITVDDPDGVLGSKIIGLNDRGQFIGSYKDANGLAHGYLLSGGKFTTIDDPAGVLGNQVDSINNAGVIVGPYTDANGVDHGYLATKAHGDFAIAGPGAGGAQGGTTTLDDLGAFDRAIADLLPPAQAMRSLADGTSVAPSKPDPLPTLPDASRVDQVFAGDRWSMEHLSFKPTAPMPESLYVAWLHIGPAGDVAGNW
jgi:uncharacterized membrane protein